jgi:ABC-type multidrug transport system ATPase subunit
LAERRRCAVLVATHRTEEAFELCDRVVVMHRGRVAASGSAAELGATLVRSRYSLWTLEPNHDEDDGRWWRVELELEGGDDAARELLSTLIGAGMPIARFERVVPPLAELIDRAIGRSMRR